MTGFIPLSYTIGRKKMSYKDLLDRLKEMTDDQLKYVALVHVGDAYYTLESIAVGENDSVLPRGRIYLKASEREYVQPDYTQ